VVLNESGELFVVVGTNHYPQSGVAVRVDELEAHRSSATGFAERDASAIIDQLRMGASVTTRYQQWPSPTNVDRRMELYGFDEALSMLRWMMQVVGEHQGSDFR
jgi:hypothetical protein